MTVPNKTSNPRKNNLFDVERANARERFIAMTYTDRRLDKELHWNRLKVN